MNILFFGDSITQGAWDPNGGWVNYTSEVLYRKTLDSNFKYYYSCFNLGISGNTSRDLKNRIEKEISDRVEVKDKSIIIVNIGVNDSMFSKSGANFVDIEEYRNNITHIISLSKEYNTQIKFIASFPVNDNLVNPIPWFDSYSYLNSEIEKYNQALFKICTDHKIMYININKHLLKMKYIDNLLDGVHPNTNGHKSISQLLNNAKLID